MAFHPQQVFKLEEDPEDKIFSQKKEQMDNVS